VSCDGWGVAGTGRDDISGRLPVGFQYQNTLETDIEFPDMTVAIEELAPGSGL
jgi:hypothetical protein